MEFYRSLYDRSVEQLDSRIERLVRAVYRRFGKEDTVVVVAGDHGEEFGEHGRVNHANYPYDELLRTPLVVANGEHAIVDRPTSLLDLKPALEALVDGDEDWQSQFSATPRCRTIHKGDPVSERTRRGLRGFSGPSPIHALISDGKKTIYDATRDRVEVYDLRTDEREQTNIFRPEDHKDLVRRVLESVSTEEIQLLESDAFVELDV